MAEWSIFPSRWKIEGAAEVEGVAGAAGAGSEGAGAGAGEVDGVATRVAAVRAA